MKLTEWLRSRSRQRRAELDERVLAELARLGGEADGLTIRSGVRTQLAVVQASLIRLETTGEVGSRLESPPGKPPRKTYFVKSP